MDEIDAALSTSRYLCGDHVTLADVRLFTTLFRFDSAYYGLFKCNRRRIQDYHNLGAYLRDMYQLPGIADTCDVESVKQDYYGNLFRSILVVLFLVVLICRLSGTTQSR